ncbi:signal peptidase I [Chengkuizengella axinellae]|uniref:Signal peptidase I n=1 Tax=Chengkuizengella axinellae TaxID=3064388 RepID=A0ABT9IYE3_9BACL|nr:signal peptidase I [Chengkuizengella sp. 2205SS18-9]MDP5274381.1 signal peptidase I [Chengkuizengella sp. 2205SS18-9]
MKWISRFVYLVLGIMITFTLFSAIGSAILKQPVLLAVIRSNSMYPLMERGDMVLVKRVREEDSVEIGDITIFKAEKGALASKGWVIHRLIEGNSEEGYITQGDANERTDQQDGSTLIERDWIVNETIKIGEKPIVIPYVGYLPLWIEELNFESSNLQLIAVGLTVYVVLNEIFNRRKKRKSKKPSKLDVPLLYFISGLTIAVMMLTTMVMSSKFMTFNYNVSDQSKGILMGSSVGVLKVGDEHTKDLVDLNNGGFFPLFVSVTSKDDQFELSHSYFHLNPGDEVDTKVTIRAQNPGKYNSKIHIGVFYPFLPLSLIHKLANISYWLALVTVSLVPGLPVMLFPLVNARLRRKTIRGVNEKVRDFKRNLSFQ